MILIILMISVAMITGGLFAFDCVKYDIDWFGFTAITIGFIMGTICCITIVCLGLSLSGRMIIDDKIALYELENANIEQQISVVIENYKGYEKDTFSQFKNESPTVLISLFPELKSNELVGKQIELYISNNATIKKLKEEKLNYIPTAWWLYFGK